MALTQSKTKGRNFHEQYLIDKQGQRRAVVLPMEEYEELLEDLYDLAILAERRDESTISFQDLKKN